jgi:hypothetical protein
MEDNVADIYYVDTRNSDHRTPGGVRPGIALPPAAAAPGRTVVMPAGTSSRVSYGGSVPMGFAQPVYAQPPVYASPPFGTTLGSLFGGINIGQVIDLIGQGFAALKSLPAAPVTTGDASTDVTNLTLYQRALAEHGKLDEQIRTGVHIVAKLLGA